MLSLLLIQISSSARGLLYRIGERLRIADFPFLRYRPASRVVFDYRHINKHATIALYDLIE